MYSTCPKCGHHNESTTSPSVESCPACGLVFSKWLQQQVSSEAATISSTTSGRDTGNFMAILARIFFPVRQGADKVEFFVYTLVGLGLAYWGWQFIAMDFRSNAIGQHWLHNVNLVFHEAGHMLFMPFGRTLMILGGSLFQVLLPLLLMLAFLSKHRDGFAAAVCLWWAGQSMMDVAPYIADARALRLPLLGGGTGADSPGMHDWANLLRPRGWLQYDIQIATVVDQIGSVVILLALLWMAKMLQLYYRKAMQ